MQTNDVHATQASPQRIYSKDTVDPLREFVKQCLNKTNQESKIIPTSKLVSEFRQLFDRVQENRHNLSNNEIREIQQWIKLIQDALPEETTVQTHSLKEIIKNLLGK